ncbi:MAG: hypothetical protein ONA69_08830 [candidate division KSB1 bacterium]|nr:hypothetical protein [candidate division KSB1 bacterium]
MTAVFLLSACTRELPAPAEPDSAVLEKHRIPSVVNPGRSYTVEVKLIGNAQADSVRLRVFAAQQEVLQSSLFDDGGAVHPESGDQAAFDNIFTCKLLWNAALSQTSELLWRFEAIGRGAAVISPLETTVLSIKNSPPVLLAVEAPDRLPSGFKGQMRFAAAAADSNGLEDLLVVRCTAFRSGARAFAIDLTSKAEAGRFETAIDSSFAAGKKGEYDLSFQAFDRSMTGSNVFEKRILIDNEPPRLVEFVHPDSIPLPGAGMMTAFLITVRVVDPQSLQDVKFVKMEWKKPDGTYSKNSPFMLYDNGLPWNEDFKGWDDGWRGDQTAGDGVYSITAIFDPTQPLGDYQLTFFAEDYAGNVSERITRIVTLHARPGLSKTAILGERPLFHHPFGGQ